MFFFCTSLSYPFFYLIVNNGYKSMVLTILQGCLPYSNVNARMVRMVHTMVLTIPLMVMSGTPIKSYNTFTVTNFNHKYYVSIVTSSSILITNMKGSRKWCMLDVCMHVRANKKESINEAMEVWRSIY